MIAVSALFAFICALSLFGQTPATVISNTGEPMRPAYKCSDEDVAFAGMECSDEKPCPIYLELSAIASSPHSVVTVGNIHSDTATLYSIVLQSDDGGATWKEEAPRVKGSALDQVQLLDLLHTWVAGETQFPLASDPFFLISSDAGQSWRRREVTDEGGPGSVQAFLFDSVQHGQLVIDMGKSSSAGRYAYYESETAGESWMLRSQTAALPRVRAAAADPSWRLEAAKDGKTWVIQKRDGGQWSNAASFLIQVGSCGAAAPEVPKP